MKNLLAPLTQAQLADLVKTTGASLATVASWKAGRPVARKHIPAVADWLVARELGPLYPARANEQAAAGFMRDLCAYTQEKVKS
jgi:hypothetical protein